MKAAAIEIRKATTPVIHVSRRFPRQAAMKNFPHRWMTMKKKKASTLQRCRELTKSPVDDTCHHDGPMIDRITPVRITMVRAARVRTPKT